MKLETFGLIASFLASLPISRAESQKKRGTFSGRNGKKATKKFSSSFAMHMGNFCLFRGIPLGASEKEGEESRQH